MLFFTLIVHQMLWIQGGRLDSLSGCEVIPVEYADIRHVKSSFKKLLRACVASVAYTDVDKALLTTVQESDWLTQLQVHKL